MIFQTTLNKVHSFLSKDLCDAIKPEPQDPAYLIILFFAYLVSIGSLFITDDATGHLILIYILIPILFFPCKFYRLDIGRMKLLVPFKFSFYNIFRNVLLCRTILFLLVVLFGADKAFLSYLHPEPEIAYLHIFFYYLLAPLIAFMTATIRLAVDQPNFYSSFFRIITPIVSLNAIINLYFAIMGSTSLHNFAATRFQAQFGAALGYNPNLDAFIYVLFFIGLLTSIWAYPSKNIVISALPCLTVLFLVVLLTQSRSCSLAAIATLSFYILNSKIKLEPRIFYILFFGILIFLLFVFFILPKGFSTYFSRLDYLRPELWVKFLHIIQENSFIGLGDRIIFAVPLSDGELAPHPHSILLSALLRGGIIGLLCMLIILTYSLWRTYKYAYLTQDFIPFNVLLTVTLAGLVDFDLKLWQAGWYLAGYWLAIALALGADSALLLRQHIDDSINK